MTWNWRAGFTDAELASFEVTYRKLARCDVQSQRTECGDTPAQTALSTATAESVGASCSR